MLCHRYCFIICIHVVFQKLKNIKIFNLLNFFYNQKVFFFLILRFANINCIEKNVLNSQPRFTVIKIGIVTECDMRINPVKISQLKQIDRKSSNRIST